MSVTCVPHLSLIWLRPSLVLPLLSELQMELMWGQEVEAGQSFSAPLLHIQPWRRTTWTLHPVRFVLLLMWPRSEQCEQQKTHQIRPFRTRFGSEKQGFMNLGRSNDILNTQSSTSTDTFKLHVCIWLIFNFPLPLTAHAATQLVHMQVTLGLQTVHPAACSRLKIMWQTIGKNIWIKVRFRPLSLQCKLNIRGLVPRAGRCLNCLRAQAVRSRFSVHKWMSLMWW